MSTYIKANRKRLHVYEDCPALLQNFLSYMMTEKESSLRSVNIYYVNNRLFLRFLKMKRDHLDPGLYDQILIDDLNACDFSLADSLLVQDYVAFLTQRGDSVPTRSHKLSAAKMFYRYLKGLGEVSENPFDGIKRPKEIHPAPNRMTQAEADQVLAAAKQRTNGERDYCITVLMVYAGLKLSELCALNTNVASMLENRLLELPGKKDAPRSIPLNQICIDAIQDWLRDRKRCHIDDTEHALFVSPITRHRLTGRAVEKIIFQEILAAGLEGKGYSPTSLRDAAVYRLLAEGAAPEELQKALGHEQRVSTTRYISLLKKSES